MIQKLRRKPVEVEGLPWDGVNITEACAFTGQNLHLEPHGVIWFTVRKDSPVGGPAYPGNWIIKGVNGDLSACRAEDLPSEFDLVDCPPELLR
jgi:hypothetical protein